MWLERNRKRGAESSDTPGYIRGTLPKLIPAFIHSTAGPHAPVQQYPFAETLENVCSHSLTFYSPYHCPSCHNCPLAMVKRLPSLPGLRPRAPYICQQCQQKRFVAQLSQNMIARNRDSADQWAAFARQIKSGERQSMLKTLEERGFIHQVTGDRDQLDQLLIKKRMGVYCGIDPTAPSLHVGHMLPFMVLFWMYFHGYEAVSILGAATSKIGDPTGRTTDRPEMSSVERKANLVSMHYQMKKLWANVERAGASHGLQADKFCRRGLINNSAWWNKLAFLDVLKYLGKGLRVGEMLAKDTVKTKMESGHGISFAEFCYPLLQSWDWWEMYQQRNIQIQIGGADQYGNIVAGVDAVKYMLKNAPEPEVRKDPLNPEDAPYGFTVPLLTTASGAKFGKSAGNAVWLDPQMTSTFDLYGYFVGTSDDDVHRFLKLFTFLPINTIAGVMGAHANDKSRRLAQHTLAYEFVALIHGQDAAKSVQNQHKTLFANRTNPKLSALLAGQSGGKTSTGINYAEAVPEADKPPVPINPLHTHQELRLRQRGDHSSASSNKYAPQVNATNAPAAHTILPKSLIADRTIAVVLWSAGLVKSRSEGHRLGEAGGAYIGRRAGDDITMRDQVEFRPAKIADPSMMWHNVIQETEAEKQQEGEEGLLVLRVGKWKVRICRIVSDEKYKAMLSSGECAEAPGWTEFLALESRRRAESYNAQMKLDGLEKENEKLREQQGTASSVPKHPERLDDVEAAYDPIMPSRHNTTRKEFEANRHAQATSAFSTLEASARETAEHLDPPLPPAWSSRPDKRKWPAAAAPPRAGRRRPPAYRAQLDAFVRQGEAERRADADTRAWQSGGLQRVLRDRIRTQHEEQMRRARRTAKETKVRMNLDKIRARRERKDERRRQLRASWGDGGVLPQD